VVNAQEESAEHDAIQSSNVCANDLDESRPGWLAPHSIVYDTPDDVV